jgi:hypothetical protein
MDPNASLLAAAQKQFQIIIERFSEADKAAYVEATLKCPNLIRLESNPDHYLESSNYDSFSAARRVLEYWALRREWFGPDRAFRPMNITGDGAMSPDDIEVLNTGFMMLLPEDNFGRGVVFHDRARLTCPEVMDVDKRKRGIFYVLSVAGESEQVRRNGLVFLSAFCDKTRKSTFDLQMLADKVSLMKKEVLPYRFVGMHLVMLSQRPILNMVVPMTLQAFEKMNCLKRGIVVHSRKPQEQLLEDLKRHGFDPESIPKVPFGGFWTLGCFRRWMEERQLKEKKKCEPKVLPSSSPFAAAEEAAGVGVSGGPDENRAEAETEEEEGEDYGEQLRKKRKMGAAYARRKRARNKIEMEVMHHEVERLKSQKEALEREGYSLQALLSEARSMVDRIDNDPEVYAQLSAVPAPVPQNPVAAQGAPPLPYAVAPTQVSVQEERSGQPVDQLSAMRYLRHFMNSFTPADHASSFPMSGAFQPLQQSSPVLEASAQLLLSLFGGGVPLINTNGSAYASATAAAAGAPAMIQPQQLYHNQENLLRSLCGNVSDE